MRTCKDKDELKNEIRQSFEKYISEFDTIPETSLDKGTQRKRCLHTKTPPMSC